MNLIAGVQKLFRWKNVNVFAVWSNDIFTKLLKPVTLSEFQAPLLSITMWPPQTDTESRIAHKKTLKSVIFWRFSHFLLTMLHQTLFYTMSSLLDQPCDIFGLKSSITNRTVHLCVLFNGFTGFTNQTRIIFQVFKTHSWITKI